MTATRPRFIVHDAAHMEAVFQAAAELGRPLAAESAAGAASALGAGVFLAMANAARARFPEADVSVTLDCADDVTAALGAIRQGVPAIRLAPPPAVPADALTRLGEMAERAGVALDATAPVEATDLGGTRDPLALVLKSLA